MTGKIELQFEAELRKWCLERAFEKRDLTKVNHMVVTNVAEEYYRWIVHGESQSNRQLAIADADKLTEEKDDE